MDYVKDLMYFGINGEKLSQTDIGIISPYKNQYQRIQEQLNMRSWHQIDCGSVELFQGKEKQIIIVSFVRSFTEKLGFLNNSRVSCSFQMDLLSASNSLWFMQRLNVLLSRPMSLLILIGNPRTLSKNEEFRHIIDMCRDRKTLVGSPYYLDENKANEANGGAATVVNPSRPNGINHNNNNTNINRSLQIEDSQTTLGQQLKRSNNRCHRYIHFNPHLYHQQQYCYHYQYQPQTLRNYETDHKCLFTNACAESLALRMIR